MGIGFFPPRCSVPAPAPAAAGCVDFVINSQAELEAQFPAAAGVHTLDEDGSYCFGEFSLTAGNRIVVPNPQRVELRGHGPSSEITGDVAGAVFTFEADARVHMHDLKVLNDNANASAVCVESDTTEAYLHDMSFVCNNGAGIRVTGGRTFLTQCRGANCTNAILVDGGEFFAMQLDVESVGAGIRVGTSATHVQWIGGRANSLGQAVIIGADLTTLIMSGLRSTTLTTMLQRTAGTVQRASVMGCGATNGTNGILWAAANIPADGLAIVGNLLNMTNPFSGFSHLTARVNSKANVDGGGLMAETLIVP